MWKIINNIHNIKLQVGSFLWSEDIDKSATYESDKTSLGGGDFSIDLYAKGCYYDRREVLLGTKVSKDKQTLIYVHVTGEQDQWSDVVIEITDKDGRKEEYKMKVDLGHLGFC